MFTSADGLTSGTISCCRPSFRDAGDARTGMDEGTGDDARSGTTGSTRLSTESGELVMGGVRRIFLGPGDAAVCLAGSGADAMRWR